MLPRLPSNDSSEASSSATAGSAALLAPDSAHNTKPNLFWAFAMSEHAHDHDSLPPDPSALRVGAIAQWMPFETYLILDFYKGNDDLTKSAVGETCRQCRRQDWLAFLFAEVAEATAQTRWRSCKCESRALLVRAQLATDAVGFTAVVSAATEYFTTADADQPLTKHY